MKPQPLEMAIMRGEDNVDYAHREGDISLEAMRYLRYLRNSLSLVKMPSHQRRCVDFWMAQLGERVAEQFEIDCRDLKNGYEMNGHMSKLKAERAALEAALSEKHTRTV